MRVRRRASREPVAATGLSALVLVALLLAGCGSPSGADAEPPAAEQVLGGLVRTPTPQIRLDPVADIDGAPFGFRAEPGGLELLYFGYLSCPDVCPTTMADLVVALDGLGADAARVGLAMASVDPGRDTAGDLRAYLDHFVPGARGLLVTDPTVLRTVADAFGATYSVQTVDGVTEVAHSGFVYALDDQGRLLVQWPFGTPAADIGRDLTTLLTRIDTPAAREETT